MIEVIQVVMLALVVVMAAWTESVFATTAYLATWEVDDPPQGDAPAGILRKR